jgi:5'-nucleotidase (lipoprotein e(P4) family)
VARLVIPVVVVIVAGALGCGQQPAPGADAPSSSAAALSGGNALAMAVAWKQTAAEYEALYIQGFNMAKIHVDRAIRDGRKKLAVISDLDDTVLDTRDYWREVLAADHQLFDDALWDAWVAKNRVKATPGALEFLTFCRDSNVEVFYITNRDQGASTMDLALGNLKAAGLPFADAEHLTVITETSDKEPRQRAIAGSHDVVVFLGDNLNDFRRHYYVTDVESRRKRLSLDRAEFGRRFILFPNPTDGHWIRAIFGESEPKPTPEHLATLHRLIGRQ